MDLRSEMVISSRQETCFFDPFLRVSSWLQRSRSTVGELRLEILHELNGKGYANMTAGDEKLFFFCFWYLTMLVSSSRQPHAVLT